MDPIALDIRLIKAVLATELKIVPGRAMMARVVSADGHGRGALSIAGVVVDAKLPKHVQAGDELRLLVRDVSADRVVLSLSDQAVVPPVSVPLPGGGSVRVSEREESASGAAPSDSHSVTLRYDAPRLGAVDLRFDLNAQSLTVAVALRPGDSLQLAQQAVDELRSQLTGAVDRTVSVSVSARHEPIELYA